MRAPESPSQADLAAYLEDARSSKVGGPRRSGSGRDRKNRHRKSRSPAGQWACDNRGRLSLAGAAASLGPTAEILAAADDGWKTALFMGAAGASAAGAWGWTPPFWLFKRHMPVMKERLIALSAPVTGSALLATLAATGGPEWGEGPGWGLALAWSLGYGGWFWRRSGRAGRADAPVLAQQIMDWQMYAAASDGPYPKSELSLPVSTKNGWSADILVPRGKKFELKLEETASALDVEDLTLVAMEKVGARRGRLTFMRDNPLQKGVLFGEQHVLDPETGLAPIGIYYDDEVAHYRFFLPGSGAVHGFVTGSSGSGKSRLLDGLLAIERRSPLVASIVIDPQGGLSLPDWPEGVACFAPSCDLGIVVLRALKALMDERSQRYNRMKWTDEKGRVRTGRAHFVPGDPDPLIYLTLDEAHKLLQHEEYGEEATSIIGSLAKEARKTGIGVRLANQSPNAAELGGDTVIRDMLQGGTNAVLRSGSSATGKRAAGSSLDGVDPGAIPKEFSDGSSTGGLGFLGGSDNRSAMFRSAYVDDPFGLVQEGETTPIEADSIADIPLLRHVLEEHALYLASRQDGTAYKYDPQRFAPGENDPQQEAQPVAERMKKPAAPAPAPAPAAVPAGTDQKIVNFLAGHGRAAAPAYISAQLGLNRDQVRTCLKRIKDKPEIPVITLGQGVWIHTDHAPENTVETEYAPAV